MARPDETRAPGGHLRFAARLSEAIAHHNLTLERISTHLRAAGTPVSIATLSYWQSGRSVPSRARSLAAVDELERFLRLPVGHLSSALDGGRAARPVDPGTSPAALALGDRALLEMGIDPVHHHRTHWVNDHVTVNADATVQTERTRQLLQAGHDGLDRVPLVFRQTSAEDVPAQIEAGAGCELGRTVDLDQHQVFAAELLLPRPLAPDELWMIEYRVTWDTTHEESHGFTRTHTRPVDYHVLQVDFGGRVPSEVHYFTTPAHAPGQEVTTRHQRVPAAPLVQVALTDPAPGAHGLAWVHDDQEPA